MINDDEIKQTIDNRGGNRGEDSKTDHVDEFFEENWAEGAVQNILDYIEDNGIYIRE